MNMEFDSSNSMIRVSIHVLSILLNGAIFQTLIKKSLFRCPSNRFVLSLATCHILVSSLTLLISLTWFIDTSICLLMEQVNVYVTFGAGVVTSLTLTIIACERYITIARPMRYKSVVTTTRCSLVIITIWLLSAVVTIIPLIVLNKSSIGSESPPLRSTPRYLLAAVFTIITFLCLSVMLVCYYVIFTIAKEKCHHVQIGQFTSSISSDWPSSAYPSQVEGQKPSSLLVHVLKIRHANEFRLQKLEETRRQKRPIQNSPFKTIATIFALIGSLVITQFPMTLTLYNGNFWNLATIMLSLSSVFNPILYGFLNRKIRVQLWKTFRIYKKPCPRLPDCCSKQQSIRSDIIKELVQVQDSHKIILAQAQQTGEMMMTHPTTDVLDDNKNKLNTQIPATVNEDHSNNPDDEILGDSMIPFPRKDSQDSGADMTFSDEEEELAKTPNVFIISKKTDDHDDDDDDEPSSHHQV